MPSSPPRDPLAGFLTSSLTQRAAQRPAKSRRRRGAVQWQHDQAAEQGLTGALAGLADDAGAGGQQAERPEASGASGASGDSRQSQRQRPSQSQSACGAESLRDEASLTPSADAPAPSVDAPRGSERSEGERGEKESEGDERESESGRASEGSEGERNERGARGEGLREGRFGADGEGEQRVRRAGTLAWAVSLVLHTVAVGGGAVVVSRMASAPAEAPAPVVALARAPVPDEMTVEIALPPMRELTALRAAASAAQAATPLPSGGEATPRPDLQKNGRGGAETSAQQALNLADHDDGLLLSKDELSRLDRSQVQRLKTAEDRASQDDRRATWKPMELTFLVSGKGARQERRELAETDPSRGARESSAPSVAGGLPGARPMPTGENEAARRAGSAVPGGERSAPGRGVLDGATGDDHRVAADSTFARPSVTEGRPAVPAVAVDRPRDNTDSDQEVASTVQALLHASTAGGKAGEGVGGERGPGKPGSGGEVGAGSSAKTVGQGTGASVDVSPNDPRITSYQRLVNGKIRAAWGEVFPRAEAIEGRQGVVIFDFVIQSNGTITGLTRTRPSGVQGFDEIIRSAIVRAAPFPPLPAVFGTSRRWRIVIDARNPVVR